MRIMKDPNLIHRIQSCLQTPSVIILFWPLSIILNVSESSCEYIQYTSWTLTDTKASLTSLNKTINTSLKANYPSLAAIFVIRNTTYLTLHMNDYYQHYLAYIYSHKRIENEYNKSNSSFNHPQGMNEINRYHKSNYRGHHVYVAGCSFKYKWHNGLIPTTKGERVGINCKFCYDSFLEIITGMLIVIFAELIPLTLSYVRKCTALCLHQLQIFYFHISWNVRRNLLEEQTLEQRGGMALNCFNDAIKLAKIKLKNGNEQQQSSHHIMKMNLFKYSTVITGTQSFSISYAEISLQSSDSGPGCVITETAIAQDCLRYYQHYTLAPLVMDRIICTIDDMILKKLVIYVLMTAKYQSINNKFHRFPKYADSSSGSKMSCKDFEISELLLKYQNLNENIYRKSPKKSCLIPLRRHLVYTSNIRTVSACILNVFQIETQDKFRSQTVAAQQNRKKRRWESQLRNSCKKLGPIRLKYIKRLKAERSKESVDKYPVHNFVKFGFCCCWWCFYSYRSCIAVLRSSKGNSYNSLYTLCHCYYQRFACNSHHYIYCYHHIYCYYCYLAFTQSYNLTFGTEYQYYRPGLQITGNVLVCKYRILNRVTQWYARHQLESYRDYFQLSYIHNFNYVHSEWHFSYSFLLCDQSMYRYWSYASIVMMKASSTIIVNEKVITYKKFNLIQIISSDFIYFTMCTFYQILHLIEYFRQYVIVVLRIRLSVPGPSLLAVKIAIVKRQTQQQQYQMVYLASDQQLKMNNLLKIFCNNWKRNRRKRRRRRRRRINKSGQKQQRISNNKKNLSCSSYNCYCEIRDLTAYKLIATIKPEIDLILVKSPKGSMLSEMRIANAKITLTQRPSKDMTNVSSLAKMTLTVMAAAMTGRYNRSRARPNLAWLLIGLVWFETPEYINCSIENNNQSQRPAHNQHQPHRETHNPIVEPFHTFSVSAYDVQPQRQLLRKSKSLRISANLVLLYPFNKHKVKRTVFLAQEAATKASQITGDAMGLKYKIKYKEQNSNAKIIESGKCLSTMISAGKNDKYSRSKNMNFISMFERQRHDWHESYTEMEKKSFDEEGSKISKVLPKPVRVAGLAIICVDSCK